MKPITTDRLKEIVTDYLLDRNGQTIRERVPVLRAALMEFRAEKVQLIPADKTYPFLDRLGIHNIKEILRP